MFKLSFFDESEKILKCIMLKEIKDLCLNHVLHVITSIHI